MLAKSIEIVYTITTTLALEGTYHSEIFERSSILNIPKSLIQILQLLINNALRLLGTLNSLSLKGLDGLDLPLDVIGSRLECLEGALNLVNDGCVLQLTAVEGEVNILRVFGELLELAAGVIVALLESDEGVGGRAFQSELAAEGGPVQLEGGTSLLNVLALLFGKA
jgi:hypothetical protein